jgi:hypothetical protein
MLPINNSDTAWLITTDYNQDNNLPYEDLREDIYCPSINNWCFEYKNFGSYGMDVGVGSYGDNSHSLGGGFYNGVGISNNVGSAVGSAVGDTI